MVTFTRACGERLFPSSIGVMSDLSAEPDMLTRISARYGQYGLDGDGVYVPDPTLFARPCYNAHAPLFALHMVRWAQPVVVQGLPHARLPPRWLLLVAGPLRLRGGGGQSGCGGGPL